MERLASIETGVEQSRFPDLVAFTSTFYKDDIEGKVRSAAFFSLLDRAKQLGIHVVVGDGGSGFEFLERARQYSNVTLVSSGKGSENMDLTMGGERRYAGKVALDAFPRVKYFLWLEPEKAELMSVSNVNAILDPMRAGVADMVVPSRKSKNTLPEQQRNVENRANLRAAGILEQMKMTKLVDFTGRKYGQNTPGTDRDQHSIHYADSASYDLWFGPKAFTRESMETEFLPYKGVKWGGIITPVIKGILDGKNVVGVLVDFTYPPNQTALEGDPSEAEKYKKKRRSQYRWVIRTIKDLVKEQIG